MTDTVMPAEPPKLRVGAVFRRAFAVLRGDFLKFFLLALLAWLPALVVLAVVGFHYAAVGLPPEGGTIAAGFAVIAVGAASLILSQAVILYGAVERMRGRSFALGRSLQQGLARLVPVIGLYILLGLTVGIGLVLLVVPGIFLAIVFFVALPACIVEREAPVESMRRSMELTKGSRWRLFGIGALLYLLNCIGQVVAKSVLLVYAGPLMSDLGVFVWSTLFGAVNAIVIAVVYHDLRAAHDGTDIEEIAAAFS